MSAVRECPTPLGEVCRALGCPVHDTGDGLTRPMSMQELRIKREEYGIHQEDLAAVMNIKQSTLSGIEATSNDPRLSTYLRYVEALDGLIRSHIRLRVAGESSE